jgi:hypothetical protein
MGGSTMATRLLFCFFLFCSAALSAQEKEFPTVIDFSTFDLREIPGYENFDMGAMRNFSPFNGAIELAPFFAYLKNTYTIGTAIETGTFTGNTTAFLGYLFNNVYTIEIDKAFFQNSTARLRVYSNIHVIFGNSPEILGQILPSLKRERLIFYLDAHWYSEWPLLRELEEISKTHRDNCIIVIDDFKVPGRRDIPYDSYGAHECSYEYVCQHLSKIFSAYKFYYLVPKSVACRAKFVAIPKEWS